MRCHLVRRATVGALADENVVRIAGIQVFVHCGGKKVASLKGLRGFAQAALSDMGLRSQGPELRLDCTMKRNPANL